MIEVELHYNAFQSLEEQLKEQGLKCADIKAYDVYKNDILRLAFHNILTDSERQKCIKRLHKQVMKDIKEEN